MKTIDYNIEKYMLDIESGKIRASKEIKALMKHVRKCFEIEDIYTDSEQLENYINLEKYWDWDLLDWEKFVIGLHLCTYWEKTGLPRWPDLVVISGRGTGKDGMIAFESQCLISPYNGIPKYDIDICANNEEQAKRPVFDFIDTLENPTHTKKLKKFYYWTKEQVRCTKTKSVIKGRTNNPKGRDGMRSGMVVFNEIHQYENYDNITVFTTGLGKVAHPRRATYTTDGDVRDGPLDDHKKTAHEILFGDMDDMGTLYMIYKLDEKEQVHDPENWVMANPTIKDNPSLFSQVKKEYNDWLINPYQNSGFMTKRMNLPENQKEIAVTSWDNISATNKPIPDLRGKECVVGIDYMKTTDWLSVNAHFKDGDQRYDVNHSWICTNSKDLARIKAPWKDWVDMGLITVVDDVEISPKVVASYIEQLKTKYIVKKVAVDDFRYSLLADTLKQIGIDTKNYKNLKLVRPSDIMKVVPIIDSAFANQYFSWGDHPPLRWATNNTKLIRHGRTLRADDEDIGNFVYGKIEAKSRKTDPFMALVASMTIEDELTQHSVSSIPSLGVYTF